MAFERHRDKDGEISRKHGNTLIRTLREAYGADFAQGCADADKLGDVLHKIHEPSLSKLVRQHEAGKLEQDDHRDRKPGLGGCQGYNEHHSGGRQPASRSDR